MHAVLGTEPANGVRLSKPARQYSDELAQLSEAIEGEQAAVFAGQPPTYRFTVARLRAQDALREYRDAVVVAQHEQYEQHRGRGPQAPTEETP